MIYSLVIGKSIRDSMYSIADNFGIEDFIGYIDETKNGRILYTNKLVFDLIDDIYLGRYDTNADEIFEENGFSKSLWERIDQRYKKMLRDPDRLILFKEYRWTDGFTEELIPIIESKRNSTVLLKKIPLKLNALNLQDMEGSPIIKYIIYKNKLIKKSDSLHMSIEDLKDILKNISEKELEMLFEEQRDIYAYLKTHIKAIIDIKEKDISVNIMPSKNVRRRRGEEDRISLNINHVELYNVAWAIKSFWDTGKTPEGFSLC